MSRTVCPQASRFFHSFVFLFIPAAAVACPFCGKLGNSFADDVAQADVVVAGSSANARPADNGTGGTTELTVDTWIKAGPLANQAAKGARSNAQTKLNVDRFLAKASEGTFPAMVFADSRDGRLVPYRIISDPSADFVQYLNSVARLAPEPARRLGFFFSHLDHAEEAIAADAQKEFAKAPYAQVRTAVKHFDLAKVRRWIADPKTPVHQLGLYGLLLGVGGNTADVGLLRRRLTGTTTAPAESQGGLLAGICLIEPKNGPREALAILCDKDAGIVKRTAAFEAVRFLLADVPEVDRAMLLDGLGNATSVAELSDFVIDELRRAAAWRDAAIILSRFDQPSFAQPSIGAAILRYSLVCPKPEAKQFLKAIEQSHKEQLAEAREAIRFDESIRAAGQAPKTLPKSLSPAKTRAGQRVIQ